MEKYKTNGKSSSRTSLEINVNVSQKGIHKKSKNSSIDMLKPLREINAEVYLLDKNNK